MKQKSFLKKLYEIFTPRERVQAVLVFFASLTTAFVQAFGVASIFPFINVVMNPDKVEQNKWLFLLYNKLNFRNINSFILFLGVAVFLIVILSGTISAITTWAKTRFTLGKNHSLSRRLLTVYLNQPYEYFLQKNSSELSKNILSEVNQLTSQLLMASFDILINGLMIGVMVIMLFMVNIEVTMGAIIFLGGSYSLINYFVKNKLRRIGKERLEANKGRFRMASEALSSIKTTKIMGIESYFLNSYSYFSSRFTRYNVFAHVIGEIPKYLIEVVAFGGIVFFVILMIAQGGKVAEFIPLLSLYAFAAYRTIPALNRLFNSTASVYFNMAIVDKIYEDMIGIELSKKEHVKPDIEMINLSFNKAIRLEEISFSYKDSSFAALKGIDLIIPKNSMIGFAGPTGCGKTTLVDTILGLLKPHKGKIIIDNTEITDENIVAWQRKIGYVPQEIYLSDDTISKNIAFGIPEKDINKEQVKYVAQIAAIDNFIENDLPKKYDTIIGERGVRLSGGEKQRIGLARALYRNPEVLVLDEATSSLDGTTEDIILKAIQDAAKLRTVIMIAHRLNTLKNCDKIFFLEQGKVIGQGKYNELIKYNKRFMEMAKVYKKK